jgi:hypothetical protein
LEVIELGGKPRGASDEAIRNFVAILEMETGTIFSLLLLLEDRA